MAIDSLRLDPADLTLLAALQAISAIEECHSVPPGSAAGSMNSSST